MGVDFDANHKEIGLSSKRYAGAAELGVHGVHVLLGNDPKLDPSKDLLPICATPNFQTFRRPGCVCDFKRLLTVSFFICSSFTSSELVSCT